MAGGAEPSRARAQRRVSGTGMQSGLQSRAGILHAAPLREEHPCPAVLACSCRNCRDTIPIRFPWKHKGCPPKTLSKVTPTSASRNTADYIPYQPLGFLFQTKKASFRGKLTCLQKNLAAGELQPPRDPNTKSFPGIASSVDKSLN